MLLYFSPALCVWRVWPLQDSFYSSTDDGGQLFWSDESLIPQLDHEGSEKVWVCPVNRSDLCMIWIMTGWQIGAPQAVSLEPAEPYAEASGFAKSIFMFFFSIRLPSATVKVRPNSLKGATCTILPQTRPAFWPQHTCDTFSSVMDPSSLCKPHHAARQSSWGNLGQALSLLIKKGIFLSSIEGGAQG